MSVSPAKLRHVVLFGFKPGATAAEVEDIVARFRKLSDEIPGIESFEWGRDVSPEGIAQGHSHAFVLTFANEAARDAYLPHPRHQAFVQWVGAFVEKALVVDYWAQA